MKMGLSYVDICREYDKKLKTKGAKMNRNKRRKPVRDKFYYCVTCGNCCFATEEEAKEYLDNLQTKGELRLLAEELNGDRVIDWQDFDQDKYYLFYDNDVECLSEDFNNVAQSQGKIYCLSKNFYEEAIKRIGKERLIKMIKSGV